MAYALIRSYTDGFATAESPAWIAADDYDSPWKEAVESYFLSLLSFTFPTPANK